jgi:hypothetical protein
MNFLTVAPLYVMVASPLVQCAVSAFMGKWPMAVMMAGVAVANIGATWLAMKG